jgi:uncharacterized RDD family membrane protein YckC
MKSISFTTSQFVTIDYELSPTALRVVSTIIDTIGLLLLYVILSFMIGLRMRMDSYFNPSGTKELFRFFVFEFPFLFYFPIIEYITKGKSLGKFILGIRAVKSTGETLELREIAIRWIFPIMVFLFTFLQFGNALVPIISFFVFFAIILCSTSSKRQRLGDLLADTVVVKTRDSQRYGLNDVLSIKNSENHEITYPEVIRFSDEDMMLVKTTIMRVTRYPNKENKQFAIEMAEKTAELLGKPLPEKRLEFLRTCLQDYIVLTR